ncbi:hypothetical protein HOLleu_24326 [Holothuria leucospilota]|uniref:Uncharacterized protein n=1 Tax=Holothuria leucospilota TaxID=206669 RepID=A0A9Q1BWB7_HOLLE|nr:hypothetical protein HOLleu_24326 [Holothuria leucospilota]
MTFLKQLLTPDHGVAPWNHKGGQPPTVTLVIILSILLSDRKNPPLRLRSVMAFFADGVTHYFGTNNEDKLFMQNLYALHQKRKTER